VIRLKSWPQISRTIRKATRLQLVFMMYAAVCGGAFGLEEMVSGSGPGLALVVLALMPLVFSLPVSLAVAEMTARFPVEGGSYRWAATALGDFWGAQSGWWTWLTSAIMNTLYAVLFVSYAKQAFPAITGRGEWMLAIALIWIVYFLNIKGIHLIGNAAIFLTILLLAPFAVITVLGLSQWKFNPVSPFHDPSKPFLAGLHASVAIAIWLYAGYDKLSAAAEETDNPQRNFLWALLLAGGFSALSYLLPTIAGLAAVGNWQSWTTGYFSVLAGKIGGPWLEGAMIAGALLSNFLLLAVTMLSASRVTMTMAQDKVFPSRLAAVHSVHQTPARSLLFNAVIYSLLALFNFQQLIFLNSVFQIANILIIFASLIAIRGNKSEQLPAFQVPFGRVGLIVLMLPTCILALAVGLESTAPKELLVLAVAALAGAIFYWISGRSTVQESARRISA
jgi:amino acid transporter